MAGTPPLLTATTMQTKNLPARERKFRFPGETITQHQTGQTLSNAEGCNVVLHWQAGAITPHSAELFSDDESEYADLGLEWDGKTLSGYDGAFDLPPPIVAALHFEGFQVGPDLCSDPRQRMQAAAEALFATLTVLLQRAEALDQSATHDGLTNAQALAMARGALEMAKEVQP